VLFIRARADVEETRLKHFNRYRGKPMRLTVIHRVIGGFGILTVLLLILSISSIISLRGIQQDITTVTESTGPLMETSAAIEADLFAAATSATKYAYTREPERMAKLEQEYQNYLKHYRQLKSRFEQLATKYTSLRQGFSKASALFKQYEQLNTTLFETHRNSVKLDSVIESARIDFEDVADELDTMLEELAESSGNSEVKEIKRLIQDATVLTTDGLRIRALATLETSLKELRSIYKDIEQKASAISDADTKKQLEKYLQAIGESGILAQHKQRLLADQKTETLMSDVNATLNQLRQALADVSEQTSRLAHDTTQSVEHTITSSQWLLIVISDSMALSRVTSPLIHSLN
jgi:methyl-accepting chemotaxis protein